MFNWLLKRRGTKRFLFGLTAVLSGFGLQSAWAQYPTRPITLIVPYTPGGITDIMARVVGEKLGQQLGQPVVIDYKAGANGVLGSEAMTRAAPNGYTLLIGSSTIHTVNPSLYKKLPFDVFKDFKPISKLTTMQNVVVVNPSLPVNNLKELVTYAKANPGKLTYGSAGAGSSMHLYTEMFGSMTQTNMIHVPYKGGAPARNDLLAGHLSLMFSDIGAVPLIQSGQLRALAVTGATREPKLPSVPTAVESGFNDYIADAWFALFAPAKTPDAVISVIRGSLAKVMAMPEVRQKLDDAGMHPVDTVSSEQLAATMRQDYDKWAKVISSANIAID